MDDCKKGIAELKEVVSGTGAQVVLLYNRGTGKRDNLDSVRGWMRKKLNVILDTIDLGTRSLRETFDCLVNMSNVQLEEW